MKKNPGRKQRRALMFKRKRMDHKGANILNHRNQISGNYKARFGGISK